MFDHEIVRERVALVVIGGDYGCGIDHGAAICDKACKQAGKSVVQIHSLSLQVHSKQQYGERLGDHRDDTIAIAARFLEFPSVDLAA